MLADILVVLALAGIGYVRWQTISFSQVPSGLDGGDWLAFGHSLLGSHSRSSTLVYPPLIPLVAVGLANIYGPLRGIQILAAISALAPSAGMYVFLRRLLGLRAVLLVSLLALSASIGEAAAWGGYPQLVGIGMLFLLLWAIQRLVSTRELMWVWIISVFLFLTLATHEVIGVAAVPIGLVFLVGLVWVSEPRTWPKLRTVVGSVSIVLGPSFTLTPIYFILGTGYLRNDATKASNQHVTWTNLGLNLENIFKDSPRLWYALLALALLAAVLFFLMRWVGRGTANTSKVLFAATASVIAVDVTAVAMVGEVRLLYLLPPVAVVGLGAWWSLMARDKWPWSLVDGLLLWIMAVVVIVEGALVVPTFEAQIDWYTALSPNLVSGLDELDATAPRDAVLAVSPAANPTNQPGWPLGWWVEGLLDRRTYYASSLQWLNTSDERSRAVLADQMFEPSTGMTGAIEIARANRINYIVVATGWTDYRAWVATKPSLDGAHVVFQNDSVLVIATDG